jgi:hypothetical protein
MKGSQILAVAVLAALLLLVWQPARLDSVINAAQSKGPGLIGNLPFPIHGGSWHFIRRAELLLDSPDSQSVLADLVPLALSAIGILCGIIAWRWKSWTFGMVAAIAIAIAAPVVFLGATAFCIFPGLCLALLNGRGSRYAVPLLALVPFTVALLYFRFPQPVPPPPQPQQAIASVTRVLKVDQIWRTEESGQPIPVPFQIAELELVPQGSVEPIRVLDTIDLDSVPGLREGMKVPVEYANADPAHARIAGGTRTYARRAMTYLLRLTYGFGLAMTAFLFVIGCIERAFRRWFHRLSPTAPENAAQRQALERYLSSRRKIR